MSVGLPSDEVAEDYKNSLEDLTMNSRYEISNLTVIAKENTEHAVAISRVLENHIRNVSASAWRWNFKKGLRLQAKSSLSVGSGQEQTDEMNRHPQIENFRRSTSLTQS